MSQQPVLGSYCEQQYGEGWRLPTMFEMGYGVNVKKDADGSTLNKGYRWGYGDNTIWSSSLVSTSLKDQYDFRYAYNVAMGRDLGWAASPTLNKSHLRCVFSAE